MPGPPRSPLTDRAAGDALLQGRACFVVGFWFFVVAAAIGLLLRYLHVRPLGPLEYGHLLHAHSHTAFLGWVYNAFFALAVVFFVPGDELRFYKRLFLVTQVGVVGMLLTFPFQGYARESIVFSSFHMVCSGVFAWRLLRRNTAVPAARLYLATAFACFFLSVLGPLALGPMAAMDLRDTPWYPFAIYLYLHFQYNGWFVCFLLAVLVQHTRPDTSLARGARAAWPWIVLGLVGTVSVSALWMEPPPWVWLVAVVSGACQVAGFSHLGLKLRRSRCSDFFSSGTRLLALGAWLAFYLKITLQWLAASPGISLLVNDRWVAIGFLHLIFLVSVTPLLWAYAVEIGWMRLDAVGRAGLAVYAVGVAVTQVLLVYGPLSAMADWTPFPFVRETLLAGAAALLAGALLGLPTLSRASPVAPGPPR